MIKSNHTVPFTACTWEKLVHDTAVSFRLTEEEAAKLSECAVPRLIAALPYLAGCIDCERTAASHLAVYLIASKGSRACFDHTESDNESVLKRLRTIMNFDGGDQAVISRGMHLLAYVMTQGYNLDRVKDRMDGNYNPLNDGAWDFDTVIAAIQNEMDRTACPEMDQMFESPIPGYWEPGS